MRILRPGRSLETFSYGADGALFAIDCEWAGGVSRRTWRRKVSRKQREAWREAAREGLIREIPRAITEAAPGEPIAAVALVYFDKPLDKPWLRYLTGPERTELMGDGEDGGLLWNPAEWESREIALHDQSLLGVLEELLLEGEDGQDILVAATRALNEHAWSVPTTDEFFVFATDLTMLDTADNAEQALPRALLDTLEARGWAP